MGNGQRGGRGATYLNQGSKAPATNHETQTAADTGLSPHTRAAASFPRGAGIAEALPQGRHTPSPRAAAYT